jgi:hypothetical protein
MASILVDILEIMVTIGDKSTAGAVGANGGADAGAAVVDAVLGLLTGGVSVSSTPDSATCLDALFGFADLSAELIAS